MELAKYADTSSWRKNIGFDPDARILIYDVNETGKYEPYYIYLNTKTGKFYSYTSFSIPIDSESTKNCIQLNYSLENMFDMRFSDMTSKELIDKALDIFANS